MPAQSDITPVLPVQTTNPDGQSSIVIVCEHASNHIPADLGNLGLGDDALVSHIAWDPGALGIAQGLSQRLDAALVSGTISRLVYDCNRPPSAQDAMPTRSEAIDVPGNVGLDRAARDARAARIYDPFHASLAQRVQAAKNPVLVTIHTFTPVYFGAPRGVEIGVLHDSDPRLADAMLACADRHTTMTVERNQPYGPDDGVTHTLQKHAIADGHLNVMLEIRNDLVRSAATQDAMSDMLAAWLAEAFADTGVTGGVACAL